MRVAEQRLDGAEDDLFIMIAAIETVAADAEGRLRPDADQRVDVLLDELAHMDGDEDPQARIARYGSADDLGQHHRFAGGSRHVDQGSTTAVLPMRFQRCQCLALIRT